MVLEARVVPWSNLKALIEQLIKRLEKFQTSLLPAGFSGNCYYSATAGETWECGILTLSTIRGTAFLEFIFSVGFSWRCWDSVGVVGIQAALHFGDLF